MGFNLAFKGLRETREDAVKLHTFLTMIIDGSEVSASRCSHTIPRRQKLIVPSNRLALKPVWMSPI